MGRKRTRTAGATAASEATAQKRREALEMRKAGKSYEVIAEALGLKGGRASAYKTVQAALRDIIAEPAEDVRKLEVERLDALYEKSMAILTYKVPGDGENGAPPEDYGYGPDIKLKAVQAVLKVQERRARLLGLDAPVRVQDVSPDRLTDAQLRAELESELLKLKAKTENT